MQNFTVNTIHKINVTHDEARKLAIEFLEDKFGLKGQMVGEDGYIYLWEMSDYHRREYDWVKTSHKASPEMIAAQEVVKNLRAKDKNG